MAGRGGRGGVHVPAVRRKRDGGLLLGLLLGGAIMYGVTRSGLFRDGRPCRDDGAVEAVLVPVHACWEQSSCPPPPGRPLAYRKHQLSHFLEQVEQDERLRNLTCV